MEDEEGYTTLEDIKEEIRNRSRIKRLWITVKYRFLALVDFPYHINRIKWFIQRGRRGYADCDCWDMSDYLTDIILPMLKKLRANSISYPGYGKASTPEKWDTLLVEMIEAFEAAKRCQDDEYYKEVSGDSLEAITNATPAEIKQWGEMARADQKIFNKKVKVFIGWFFHLWD